MSGNENLMGHNSSINLQNMTRDNLKIDLANINEYAEFGQISSICSQDIDRKRNSDIYQGPEL